MVTKSQSYKLKEIEDTLSFGSPGKLLTFLWYTGLAGMKDKLSMKIGADSISQANLAD